MEALTASRVAAQMMQNLLLEEGDIVTIRSATLRKGTYVKLQPHTKVRGLAVRLMPWPAQVDYCAKVVPPLAVCNTPAVRQDFLDISNPKAVLETTLRGYSCLTKGDCICLHYNNKRYYIDIVEAKPEASKALLQLPVVF